MIHSSLIARFFSAGLVLVYFILEELFEYIFGRHVGHSGKISTGIASGCLSRFASPWPPKSIIKLFDYINNST